MTLESVVGSTIGAVPGWLTGIQVGCRRLAAVGNLLIPLLLFIGFLCQPAAAGEKPPADIKGRFFLIVWAYQGPDDDLVHAHTFTSFYRGDDVVKGVVRPATISWLPATGAVQLFGAEKGRNFSLDETLRMACLSGRQVKAWGPYEIKPELYQRAMHRIRELESGRIRYSMVNDLPTSMNCITAAGDITPVPLHTGILWGVAASAQVVRHLSPYFIGDASTDLKDLALSSMTKACPGRANQLVSNARIFSIP